MYSATAQFRVAMFAVTIVSGENPARFVCNMWPADAISRRTEVGNSWETELSPIILQRSEHATAKLQNIQHGMCVTAAQPIQRSSFRGQPFNLRVIQAFHKLVLQQKSRIKFSIKCGCFDIRVEAPFVIEVLPFPHQHVILEGLAASASRLEFLVALPIIRKGWAEMLQTQSSEASNCGKPRASFAHRLL